jgi:hypothetical protein
MSASSKLVGQHCERAIAPDGRDVVIDIVDHRLRVNGRCMTIIRVEFTPEFMLGDDVVLLTMDGAGIAAFAAALKDAERQGASQLQNDGVTHEFIIQADEADIDLDDTRVVWRLDAAKAVEIIESLDILSNNDRPSHQYVDISKPAETLVLSRDEYVSKS